MGELETAMMVRALIPVLVGIAVAAGGARADDKSKTSGDKNAGKGHEATITKVDPKAHTLTVKMKGKDGKETERKFKLTEEARYFDSTGKVAALDVFRSGDYVLVVEEEGRLKELHKQDKATTAGSGKKPK